MGEVESVVEMLSSKLPNLRMHARTPELVSFRLDVSADELGNLVQVLEDGREHGIKDYSLNQSSLEEVFLRTVDSSHDQ